MNAMRLTSEQELAIAAIKDNQYTLLHGVTGSGKTEVYLQVALQVVAQGLQVVFLVPEISLTPQTEERIKNRFAKVAVIHSRLTPASRRKQWKKIIDQEVDVVVGARSALFAPLPKLGLIIVDEEHDSSYKQDSNPRYHAVLVAMQLAKLKQAKLVLGSATPSLDTYYNFINKTLPSMSYVRLHQRVAGQPMPKMELVDMRQELNSGNFSLFSRRLRELIADRLSKKEQIILFLNRRGHSTFVSCRSCGYVMECQRCNVSLTYHEDGTLRCHYCNHSQSSPTLCPECGSKYIKYFGSGTQRVESEIRKYFGQAKIARMDKDTTQKRTSHQDILADFANGAVDILLGTQMIAKGLDFPNVTLVGIISADSVLHLPDFRAAERTYQLIKQVAGRSGRSDKGGAVVVQSYSTTHYAIQAAVNYDWDSFVTEELKQREQAGYPPYTKLIAVTVSAAEPALAKQVVTDLARRFPGNKVLGPVPCTIHKLRGLYRWHFLLKDEEINYADFASEETKGVKIDIDVDPVNLY